MKQVILVRKDLEMTAGKAAAQVAHAAMLFILKRLGKYASSDSDEIINQFTANQIEWMFGELHTIEGWEYGGIKKIVLMVDDLTHMHAVVGAARASGLECHFVIDEGLQATTTCAIGPDEPSKFTNVTDTLELYK